MSRIIKGIYLEPAAEAREIEFDDTLETLQKLVGGYIEAFYPFPDEVAIICNDEGKINGMDPNRPIYDEDGNMVDILFGPAIIVGISGEDFSSLTNEQEKKYMSIFENAYRFSLENGRVVPQRLASAPAKVGDYIHLLDVIGLERYNGRCGYVKSIDPFGQLHGTWGSVELGEGDVYEIINDVPAAADIAKKHCGELGWDGFELAINPLDMIFYNGVELGEDARIRLDESKQRGEWSLEWS